jgi:hypothetical protein
VTTRATRLTGLTSPAAILASAISSGGANNDSLTSSDILMGKRAENHANVAREVRTDLNGESTDRVGEVSLREYPVREISGTVFVVEVHLII